MRLPGEVRRALREALQSAYPTVSELEQLLREELDVPFSAYQVTGAAYPDLVGRVIDDFAAKGRWRELVRRARDKNGQNPDLRQFILEHFHGEFTEDELHELLACVEQECLTEAESLDAFNAAKPPAIRLVANRQHDAYATFRLIAETFADSPRQSDGTWPLLRFVACAEARLDSSSPVRSRLRSWRENTARRHRIDPAHLLRAPTQTDASDLRLMVTMDSVGPGQCIIRAFVSTGPGEPLRCIHSDVAPRSVTTVGALVNELRDHIADDLDRTGDRMLVELFVPRDLLCHEPERWELRQGPHCSLFGFLYPVVMRSWDRAYGRDRRKILPSWKTRWRALVQLQQHQCASAVVWEPDPQRSVPLFQHLITKKDALCLALRSPPSQGLTGPDDGLDACIWSGIPAAVWPRLAPARSDILQAELAKVLERLPELPHCVLDKRQEAARGERDHIGHFIAVLWDDPFRLPPEVDDRAQLEAPTPSASTT